MLYVSESVSQVLNYSQVKRENTPQYFNYTATCSLYSYTIMHLIVIPFNKRLIFLKFYV